MEKVYNEKKLARNIIRSANKKNINILGNRINDFLSIKANEREKNRTKLRINHGEKADTKKSSQAEKCG